MVRIRHCFIAFFTLFFSVNALTQSVAEPEDKTIFVRKIKTFHSHDSLDHENQIVHIGKSFLGTPYVEKTLEIGETEAVVINLRGLDCTTFVENVIAFSMLLQEEKSTFEEFVKSIESIRYKNGKVSGYASRLHYFTDWIRTNELKGLVEDITAELGGISVEKPINFMGTHRGLYPFLKDEANYNRILETEAELASKEFCYLPQAAIEKQEIHIASGDIIALATSIKGLDVTHTGIAIRQPSGRIHLLHASISGEVKITEEPLVDYLKKVKNNIGIIIARPTL